mmetsp:Transcript_10717/g.10626  ORF Transcript_10717/g.10626 Transcript_10717/m.10626 type:complete len:124 (+) Transcript_10717:38-409(+)
MGYYVKGMAAGARFARARGASAFARAYNANFHARSISTLSTLPRIVGEAPMHGFAEQIPPLVSMSMSCEMTSAGGCAAKTIPEDELEEMIALAFQLSSKILTTSVMIDNNISSSIIRRTGMLT